MSFDPSKDYNTILWEGIRAAKDGSKNLAWVLLNQATQLNPFDATPWMWLTEATDDPVEKEEYLEKALALDPGNIAVRRGLEKIKIKRGSLDEPPAFNADEVSHRTHTVDPVVASAKRIFSCPGCGGPMDFNLQTNTLTCLYCGLAQVVEERSAADDEQVMARVLPTEQGHLWAAAQHKMVCGKCGANSLWPPGQTAAECPYCGSRQLLQSEEIEDLIDPQGIAVMQIDESQAAENIVQWLGKGWTTPDDLKESARKSLLRPAYYPFWTFDGTLEVQWSCYVNESNRDNQNWAERTGVEFELFDDVLIPGLKSMKFSRLRKMGKFYLKDVVDFKLDYLAGWPALTYDRSLADATLLAREQIVRKVRRELNFRVLPGIQKRDIQTGRVNWQAMTFKLVLLPVWIGEYRYKGKSFSILVNGQTGHVAGEKPKDTFLVIGILISIIFTIIVLGLIGAIIASVMGWL